MVAVVLGGYPCLKKGPRAFGVARGRSRGSRNYLETGPLREGAPTPQPAAVRTTMENTKRAISLSPSKEYQLEKFIKSRFACQEFLKEAEENYSNGQVA